MKAEITSQKSKENIKQLNIKNETELIKKLNYICGTAENMELIFYESNDKEQKDKQLGKFIIEMIFDSYKKCDNEKCKNNMSNHYYYLYNSDYSRIKITYISKEDSNLGQIIEYIQSKDAKFKYPENTTQINEIDYNIDIFSYGFCKICKKERV